MALQLSSGIKTTVALCAAGLFVKGLQLFIASKSTIATSPTRQVLIDEAKAARQAWRDAVGRVHESEGRLTPEEIASLTYAAKNLWRKAYEACDRAQWLVSLDDNVEDEARLAEEAEVEKAQKVADEEVATQSDLEEEELAWRLYCEEAELAWRLRREDEACREEEAEETEELASTLCLEDEARSEEEAEEDEELTWYLHLEEEAQAQEDAELDWYLYHEEEAHAFDLRDTAEARVAEEAEAEKM